MKYIYLFSDVLNSGNTKRDSKLLKLTELRSTQE